MNAQHLAPKPNIHAKAPERVLTEKHRASDGSSPCAAFPSSPFPSANRLSVLPLDVLSRIPHERPLGDLVFMKVSCWA